MPTLVKLASEFKAFVRAEQAQLTTELQKKLVNLVLGHFDSVASVGSTKGARSTVLKDLIVNHGNTVASTIDLGGAGAVKADYSFVRLEHIELESFRGYTDKETLPLNKDFAFIFGPNGSGKSSLCEAMEFSLLGYVNESIAKRIDIEFYLKNHMAGGKRKAVMHGKDKGGAVAAITPNEDLHRYIFIERSRIDGFARLAANTPSGKQELIAKLFGLDEFNDFVGHFTDNIEKQWLPASTKEPERVLKAQEVERKKNELQDFKSKIDLANDAIVSVYRNAGFDSTEAFLASGKVKLDELSKQIAQLPQKKVTAPSAALVIEQMAKAQSLIQQYATSMVALSQRANEVNFKALYEAAKSLNKEGMKECPLCETEIEKVKVHPVENSITKLEGLKELSKIQGERDSQAKGLEGVVDAIGDLLVSRGQAAAQLGFANPLTCSRARVTDTAKLIETFKALEKEFGGNKVNEEGLDQKLAAYNAEVDGVKETTQKLENDKKAISEGVEKVKTLEAGQKPLAESVQKWTEDLAKAEAALHEATEAAKAEAAEIQFWQNWIGAYKSVTQILKAYREKLPLAFVAKLNELTRDIYNTINFHDKPFEKAARLELPSDKDQSIQISFQNAPDVFVDALVVLSEGHLRCLGLAILVAKNVSDGCPAVIFDDVVNAIDSDHQAGVRKLVFESGFLKGKQVILTTHSEPFIRALENDIPKAEFEERLHKYELQMDSVQRKIRVGTGSRSYLAVAEQCLEAARTDDALLNLRRSLENISNRLWTKLGSMMRVEIRPIKRAPNLPSDLMSVVTELNAKLQTVEGPLAAAKPMLAYLLGLQANNNLVWNYLNTGTHESEDKPELDRELVKAIYVQMVALDKVVKGEGGTPPTVAAKAA